MFNFGKNKSFSSSIEYIVVGLGNPDKKYEKTRHNAGFIAIDTLAKECGCNIDRLKFKSNCADTRIGDSRVLLMKPQTYMNNSGQAVCEAMSFYKVPPEKVIVIMDDISLPVGKMRVKRKGSDGGQRGMGNIIYLSGSDQFPRIKIGVGSKPSPEWDLADWVLSKFSDNEYKTILEMADNVYPAVKLIIGGQINEAMNKFN